jgi:hypothetical protein
MPISGAALELIGDPEVNLLVARLYPVGLSSKI